jgi:hypothetical protein
MVPFMFSMMLVQARERRKSVGRRTTHRISSSPFEMGYADTFGVEQGRERILESVEAAKAEDQL